MLNEAMFPPELLTSIALNATPLKRRKFEVESVNCGSGSNTSMENVNCDEPPSFKAVTVNNSEVELTRGVP